MAEPPIRYLGTARFDEEIDLVAAVRRVGMTRASAVPSRDSGRRWYRLSRIAPLARADLDHGVRCGQLLEWPAAAATRWAIQSARDNDSKEVIVPTMTAPSWV